MPKGFKALPARLFNFLQKRYLPILFFLLLPLLAHRVGGNLRGVIWSDAEGYYKYLPGLFVLGDFHKMPEGSVWPLRNDSGEILIKYTCGVAYFEAPFFLVARCFVGENDDIFLPAYAWAVALSGYLCCFLGLFFLQKALLRRFGGGGATFWALMCVFLGTNLFHYATKEPGMSHAYSFLLLAFLVWQTPRFFEACTSTNAALMGGALGWAMLIRPTNAVVLLFPLLHDVYTRDDWRKRVAFLSQNRRTLLAGLAAGAAFWLPQMLYWREMTGRWLLYSYVNEHFIFWDKPKLAAVLLDPQNGLLLYSPVAFLMLAGIGLGLRRRQWQAPSLALIFGISTYLFASWWAWWFGGAFGHRCYVELFALLSIPLAGVLQKILALRQTWARRLSLSAVAFLLFYSVRLSLFYSESGIPWDGKDWRWNFEKLFWAWSHLFDFLH